MLDQNDPLQGLFSTCVTGTMCLYYALMFSLANNWLRSVAIWVMG